MSQQITTLTFYKYSTLQQKIWGFGMMQFAHKPLKTVKGLLQYQLMGSGKGNGFNPWPDWSTYCVLQIWESEDAANQYFSNHELIKKYQQNSTQQTTYFLKNLIAKGTWYGKNPFAVSVNISTEPLPVAIITRATIKLSKVRTFWKYVPTSQKHIMQSPGLLFTKGIGEVPVFQMATFSVWENIEAMQGFAYKNKEHRVAIEKTRTIQWYKEELFARFQLFKTVTNNS